MRLLKCSPSCLLDIYTNFLFMHDLLTDLVWFFNQLFFKRLLISNLCSMQGQLRVFCADLYISKHYIIRIIHLATIFVVGQFHSIKMSGGFIYIFRAFRTGAFRVFTIISLDQTLKKKRIQLNKRFFNDPDISPGSRGPDAPLYILYYIYIYKFTGQNDDRCVFAVYYYFFIFFFY